MTADFYQLLKQLIWCKTISYKKSNKEENEKCSKEFKTLFESQWFETMIFDKEGAPVIVAMYKVGKDKPTALIYGHYDIQETQDEKLWKNNPYSLLIGKEKLIGKWVTNKGQLLLCILNIFDLIKEKKLSSNITFIIEWEKETGSYNLLKTLEKNQELIKADYCFIPLWETIGEYPSLVTQQRGEIVLTINLQTALTELNQSFYSGNLPNAAQEMNRLLNKLYDQNNLITIPYFYYDVEDIPTEVKIVNKKNWKNGEEIAKSYGIKQLFNVKDYDMHSRTGLKPHIEINSIITGSDDGYMKNSIPWEAKAKITIHIVPNQKVENVIWAFGQWIKSQLPKYVKCEITEEQSFDAQKIERENIFFKRADESIKTISQKNTIKKYNATGLAIVDYLKKKAGQENIVRLASANEDANPDWINENIDTAMLKHEETIIKEIFSK